MKTANPLNLQAIALEEAETKIRLIVKEEYFRRTEKKKIDKKIFAVLRETEREIKIPALREAAVKSLLRFYNRQYEELRRSFGWQFFILSALFLLQGKTPAGEPIRPTAAQTAAAERTLEKAGYGNFRQYGVPLQKFSRDYMEKNVRPALDRLAKQFARDPDDVSGRNSLRNRAEMEVRYHGHLEQIEELRAGGNKLVIASTHSDCSERCAPWQGRVYSLDGTSGVTDDGRKYVPLEQATDIYYTTKAGKTYKNGLLGFNCRHYLVPYQNGYRFPKPNAATERKEYAVTKKQRQLESAVRKWKTVAAESKGIDGERYAFARKKAAEWNKKYIAYSVRHGRAYYPSRTKLI